MFPYSRMSTVNKYLNIHIELWSNSFPQAFQRPAKGGELEVSIISGVNFTFICCSYTFLIVGLHLFLPLLAVIACTSPNFLNGSRLLFSTLLHELTSFCRFFHTYFGSGKTINGAVPYLLLKKNDITWKKNDVRWQHVLWLFSSLSLSNWMCNSSFQCK